jgi:hypothetical protein
MVSGGKQDPVARRASPRDGHVGRESVSVPGERAGPGVPAVPSVDRPRVRRVASGHEVGGGDVAMATGGGQFLEAWTTRRAKRTRHNPTTGHSMIAPTAFERHSTEGNYG